MRNRETHNMRGRPFSFGHTDRKTATRDLLHGEKDTYGERDRSFRRIIFSIPPGKVSTYGKVAAAAGYPLYHRAVARLLRTDPPDQLPWHRVLGAGGEIKLTGAAAKEQRARLRIEGVQFRGKRVDMDRFEYVIRPWEVPE
ncbi:MAG TPA: MGMT family protein [Acidobacteriaceae bacterium]|jgi:methylated-DNA-protein-cysteine methyltransferase-like protein